MDKRPALVAVGTDSSREQAEALWRGEGNQSDVPGLRAAHLFRLSQGLPPAWELPGSAYLMLYNLDSAESVEGAALQMFGRAIDAPKGTGNWGFALAGVFEQIYPAGEIEASAMGATHLLLVGHADIPTQIDEEYNAWYETEHIPSYLEIPGILTARRFRRISGSESLRLGLARMRFTPPFYMALYDLATNTVFETPAFKQRSVTPWSTRIRNFTWSCRVLCTVYERTATWCRP